MTLRQNSQQLMHMNSKFSYTSRGWLNFSFAFLTKVEDTFSLLVLVNL